MKTVLIGMIALALIPPPADPPASIREIGWRTAEVVFDRLEGPCGHPSLRDPSNGWRHSIHSPAYADLTGDGVEDVVVTVTCWTSWSLRGFRGTWLVQQRGDGRPHAIAFITGYHTHWVENGVLYTDDPHRIGAVIGYRKWTGSSWETTAGFSERITSLDLSPVAAQLSCRGLPIPHDLKLSFDERAHAVDGDREWQLEPEGGSGIWADLGRQARPYLLVEVGCRGAGDVRWDRRVVVLDHMSAGRRVVAALDLEPNESWGIDEIRGRVITVVSTRSGLDRTVRYRWDGAEFLPEVTGRRRL